jgi:hypothetical protein
MRRVFGGIGSFLQTPFGVLFVTTLAFHGILYLLGLDYGLALTLGASLFILIVDAVAAFFLLDRLIYFFSQFVLPVQTPQDRHEIYARVSGFDGGRGQILFVKNGRVIKHKGEEEKTGPGVIVMDTASAVVIQTDTQIIGPAGPGIRFTAEDEKIACKEGVDLRTQWQFIGPAVGEKPFTNPVPIGDPVRYNETQARRRRTAGLTRDGFEVAPSISIKFRIKEPQVKGASESGVTSQYGYNAAAVLDAVTREVIELNPNEDKRERMDWDELPAHLVVNLWREYVRKFKLGDLFNPAGPGNLQTIEDFINRRLKRPLVIVMDETGIPSPAGEALPSLEHEQLTMRGVEIIEVRIHNVMLEPDVESQNKKNWTAEWTRHARREADHLNEREKLIETASRQEAGRNFARIASRKYNNPILPVQDNIFTTLQNLIEPLKEVILIENRANNQMEAELRKLEEVWKWLRIQQLDAAQHREERRS